MLQASLRIGWGVAVTLLLAWMAWEATSFHHLARYFPLTVTVAGAVLGLCAVITETVLVARSRDLVAQGIGVRFSRTSVEVESEAGDDNAALAREFRSGIHYIAWIIGYVACMWAVGLVTASALFLLAFLWLEARVKLRWALLAAVLMAGLVLQLELSLGIYWPHGHLIDIFANYADYY